MESIKEWRGSSFIKNPFSLLNYAKGGNSNGKTNNLLLLTNISLRAAVLLLTYISLKAARTRSGKSLRSRYVSIVGVIRKITTSGNR